MDAHIRGPTPCGRGSLNEIGQKVFEGWSRFHMKAIRRFENGHIAEASGYGKGDDGFLKAMFHEDCVIQLEVPNSKLQKDGTTKASRSTNSYMCGSTFVFVCECFCFVCLIIYLCWLLI